MAKNSNVNLEELREKNFQAVKKACVFTDIAYALAEAADTFMLDTNQILNAVHAQVRQEEKLKLKNVKAQGKLFKAALSDFSRKLYLIDSAEIALGDADELYDLIRLIIDRVGGDYYKFQEIKKLIYDTFESKYGYYSHP